MSVAWRPVVIIGAPRSGTNMLRDALAHLPGVATWPCDEINLIWRHGNVRHPSDEFGPDLARASVCRYIRRRFDWVARRFDAPVVVEKTCANSLRVPFVDRVVPEAQYVFIHRDGLDAVGSALKRWNAKADYGYLARKARFVPPTDLPYYAVRYAGNRLRRLLSPRQRPASWGPRLERMPELLERHPLDEVCALQWKRCVESSLAAFARMPAGRVVTVGYEDFVRSPESQLAAIVRFLGIGTTGEAIADAVAGVSDESVGKGRDELGEATVRRLMPMIGDTRRRLGYP